jgi:ribulose-5-phosphate 4-epimerase/fuculose-1-phosphate aldolase
MEESQARKLIIEVGKLLYERSYVVSSDGNVSIRLDENRIGNADDDLQRSYDRRNAGDYRSGRKSAER